jgi:hypothetical protein
MLQALSIPAERHAPVHCARRAEEAHCSRPLAVPFSTSDESTVTVALTEPSSAVLVCASPLPAVAPTALSCSHFGPHLFDSAAPAAFVPQRTRFCLSLRRPVQHRLRRRDRHATVGGSGRVLAGATGQEEPAIQPAWQPPLISPSLFAAHVTHVAADQCAMRQSSAPIL